MVRKSFFAGFSYLAGLICACIGWGKNNLIFALFAVGVGFVLLFMAEKYRRYVIFCTVSFLVGIGANSLYTHFHYDKLIKMDGKTVSVNGYVQDMAYLGADKCRLTVCGKINGHKTSVDFFVDDGDFDYYDRVTIIGKVYKITDSINYQAEKYKRPKGIFLKGGAAEKCINTHKNANPIFCAVKHCRDSIFDRITDKAEGDAGAFLGAMLCGDKTELSEGTKAMLYRSGIGHIFAVSGTHLVLITSIFSFVLSKVVRSIKLRFWFLMPLVWGFAVFAGFSPSVVRAAVMMSVLKALCLFARDADYANSLGFSAVVLTAFSPYEAVDISFLMSFAAAFAVGVAAPKVNKLIKQTENFSALKRSFSASCVILFVTMPLSIYFFGGVSVISPVSNIVLLPLCTAALSLTFFAALLGITWVSMPFLFAAKWLIKAVLLIAKLLSDLPFSYITAEFTVMKILMLASCLIPVILAVYSRKIKFGMYSAVTVLMIWCMCGNIFKMTFGGYMRVLVLPNGKNAQAAVVKNGKAVIFDMGCKGKLDSGIQRLCTARAVDKIYCDFLSDRGFFSSIAMEQKFVPTPQKYAVSGISDNVGKKIIPFDEGSSMEFDGVKITLTEEGYMISENDKNAILDGSNAVVNGIKFDLSNENAPFEISIYETEIRRLDYGFGKSN